MKLRLDDRFSFRLVAFGVALVLWASILGRRDSTLTREYTLQVLLAPSLEEVDPAPKAVKVEIAGPRVALKKISEADPIFTIDLSAAGAGRQIVRLSRDGLSLPIGARILSIEPPEIVFHLRHSKPQEVR